MSDLPLAALVLVGGYGTRLRPLTFTRSKPLVEFCNQPMVKYMLDALRDVGVEKIVFALSEMQSDLTKFIDEYQAANPSVKIVPSVETEAMGTAGPIALAKKHLAGHRFFMLNSDVISPYPFAELLAFHKAKGGQGTIMSWDVEDPSRFGVILSGQDGKVSGFVEKPKQFVGRAINAGHYIFEPSVIDRVQPRPTSIEKEIFPAMAADGQLFVMPLHGFWMDIGTPSSFIEGIPIFLKTPQKVLVANPEFVGEGSKIGPNAVVGKNVHVGRNCHIENAVILEGSKIGDNCEIKQSIIGWRCKLQDGVKVDGMTILGEDVAVSANSVLKGAIVCPHKSVAESILSPKIIL